MVYTLLQQKDSVAKGLITLKVKGQLYSYFSALLAMLIALSEMAYCNQNHFLVKGSCVRRHQL